MNRVLSIIVLNYNRLEYTKQTIGNLIAKTTVPHEFIFVDNCSTDGTKQYLASIKKKTNAIKVSLVFNKYNYGVAGGRNSGMIYARGNYIITIDDDIIVPEGYDKKLILACDKIKDLGMIGVSVEKKDYPIVNKYGINIQLKSDNIGGGCICFPKRTMIKVGYYSTDFLYGGEDCDMHLRLKYLKLINGYIIDKGIHLGAKDSKEQYKLDAHSAGSKQVKKVATNIEKYVKRRSAYVPYSIPVKFVKGGNGEVKW